MHSFFVVEKDAGSLTWESVLGELCIPKIYVEVPQIVTLFGNKKVADVMLGWNEVILE